MSAVTITKLRNLYFSWKKLMVKKYSGWNKMRLNYNTGYFKHNLYRNDRMWQMQETGGLWEDCPWVRLVTNSDSLGSEGPGEASARLPGSALHTHVQVQTDKAEALRGTVMKKWFPKVNTHLPVGTQVTGNRVDGGRGKTDGPNLRCRNSLT